MCKLPFNSAVGSDGISAEHICFADSTVAHYLSLFCNTCILQVFIRYCTYFKKIRMVIIKIVVIIDL